MKTKFLIHHGRMADVIELDGFVPENPTAVGGGGGKRFNFRESEGVMIICVGETRHVFDVLPNQRQLIENYLFSKLGEGWKTISR